ncbi:hypothetical protein KKA02_00885 [Patescibacteria group bacterium]|nr:hypothetical protein [Patescibacteria group bacterium]
MKFKNKQTRSHPKGEIIQTRHPAVSASGGSKAEGSRWNCKTHHVISFLLLLSFYFLLLSPVSAQITNPLLPNANADIANPQAFMSRFLQTVTNIFMIVGVVYFLWHISMASYHFMATEGDKSKWENAKNEITHGAVGIAILFSVFALLKVIGIVFGIQSLQDLRLSLPSL